ncbi:MAG: hypothetical protein HRT40_11965 [Campylobacteraceae bacterium]|nr:hypothetical protein [Campylobacteraceae bacterium]
MKNKYVIPLLLILEGVSSFLFEGSITKTILEEGSYNVLYSLSFIGIGFAIIMGDYLFFNNYKNIVVNKIEFSKCYKCKKSYNYIELKKGICPKCNIETIEIEDYYKKYPYELKDI